MFEYFKSKKKLIEENQELRKRALEAEATLYQKELLLAHEQDAFRIETRTLQSRIETLSSTVKDLRTKLNQKITLSLLLEVMKSYEEKEEE